MENKLNDSTSISKPAMNSAVNSVPLTFAKLRDANIKRMPVFKNSKGQITHSKPDGSDWSIEDWAESVVGEIGEWANLHKKFRRKDIDSCYFTYESGLELADIMIYSDILMLRCGITLQITDFSELEIMAKERMDRECSRSPSSWLMDVHTNFGYLFSDIRGPAFIAYLVSLNCLALSVNCNLGDSTRQKFNAVSRAIGCDITI